MTIVKVFFDLETTGVDPKKHSVHQLSGIVELDGVVFDTFDIKTRPHPKAEYTAEGMNLCKVSEEQIRAYQPMKEGYKQFISIIGSYIDKFNPKEKAYLVGFNNRSFDDVFLRVWFEQNGDKYIGSLFWNNTIDTLVLATEYFLERRHEFPSFKLKRVAKECGIIIEEDKLHDASYDVELTRKIYKIITGR